MPTYEYRCANGHEFELFQRITDKPRAKCPECGAKAVRTISGGAGLIFKGSGFYITDYGKDGKGPRRESEKADSAKPADQTDAAAKPEAPKPEVSAGEGGGSKKPKKTGPKDAS